MDRIHGRNYARVDDMLKAAHKLDAVESVRMRCTHRATKLLPDYTLIISPGADEEKEREKFKEEQEEKNRKRSYNVPTEPNMVVVYDDVCGNEYLSEHKAIVALKNGEIYEGVADAHPFNIQMQYFSSIKRMSATRALGRALRHAFGTPTVAEEMKEESHEEGGD